MLPMNGHIITPHLLFKSELVCLLTPRLERNQDLQPHHLQDQHLKRDKNNRIAHESVLLITNPPVFFNIIIEATTILFVESSRVSNSYELNLSKYSSIPHFVHRWIDFSAHKLFNESMILERERIDENVYIFII